VKHLGKAALVFIIAVTVVVSGCGGGGGVTGPNWLAYTPPPEVAGDGEQGSFAGDEVIAAIQEIGGISEANPWAISNANIDALVALASQILQESGLMAASVPDDAPATTVAMMANFARYLAEQMPQSEDEVRPAETYPIDWPIDDIHWVGSIVITLNTISGSIHGEGPNTDADIQIHGTLGLTAAHATITGDGYISCLLNVEDWDGGVAAACTGYDYEGRAYLDDYVSLIVNREGDEWTDFSGTWDMNDEFAIHEAEQWVVKNKIEGTHAVTGTIGEDYAFTFEADLDYYFGVLAGEGFLWAHHDGTLAGAFDSDQHIEWFSLSQEIDLGNGMTATIVVEDWLISGEVRDAEGELLATFSGNLQAGTGQIEWVGGPTEEIEWHWS